MTHDFISQYMLANSGTTVPPRYHLWSGIALLMKTLGRRVFVDHKHFQLNTGIYICLVGSPASKKTSAMQAALNMFAECFPDAPLGVSKTSPEDIVKMMASEACTRYYQDKDQVTVEWHPLANFISEFTDWLAFNPYGMIEMLTGIYDVPFYNCSTLKRGRENIIRPYLTILACTTPDKIVKFMKSDIIGGGFSRRILFAYETKLPGKNVFPTKSPEAYEAEKWCKEHLLKISTLAGPFEWTPEARSFIQEWFIKIPPSTDPVLSGYFESKDVIVQKVAMCIAAAQPEPKLLLTLENIETAIALVEANEDNLDRLTVAVGRNELGVPQQKLMLTLADRGGWMPEFVWHKLASVDMNEMEYKFTKQALIETKQIVETFLLPTQDMPTPEKVVILYEKALEMRKAGTLK